MSFRTSPQTGVGISGICVKFSGLEKEMFRAAPRNSARSLRQDFCPNSKFGKRRNPVCISGFSNGRSGAKRRRRLADAIVRCCPKNPGDCRCFSTVRCVEPFSRFRLCQEYPEFQYCAAECRYIAAYTVSHLWTMFPQFGKYGDTPQRFSQARCIN